MKWFRVDSNTPGSRTARALDRQMGNAGLGAMLKLWCYVAERGGADPGRAVDSDGHAFTDEDFRDATGLNEAEWETFLAILIDKGHIDRRLWESERVLYLPGMLKRADETTQRRMRDEASKSRDRSTEEPPADVVPFTPANAGDAPADAGIAPATVQDSTGQDTTDRKIEAAGAAAPGLFSDLPAPAVGPTPERLFVDAWNAEARKLPQVRTMNEQRRKRIRAVAKVFTIEQLRELFAYLNADPFYNGDKPSADYPNFHADLDFVIQPGKVDRLMGRMETAKRRAGIAPAGGVKVANGNMRVVPSDAKRARFGALTQGRAVANG